MEGIKPEASFEDQKRGDVGSDVTPNTDIPDLESLGPFGALYVYYYGRGVQPWLKVNRHGHDRDHEGQ